MPRGYLDYPFTEPLLEVEGYYTSDMEGVAEIEYSLTGEWEIKDIYLDGVRYVDRKRQEKPIKLDRNGPIYKLLYERLTSGQCWRSIAYNVRDEIEQDRQPDPDAERERRRDFFAESPQ